jgi:hypothetical protein
MDANAIVITAAAAAALGLGAGAGFKLIPALFQARREMAVLSQDHGEGFSFPTLRLFPLNKRRESSIVGLYRASLRHADGSFTRAYHVELEPSVFCDDLILENRCNSLARLLAARKPVGTVIQFRLSSDIDPGLALVKHAKARDRSEIHQLASILHDEGLRTYEEMTLSGSFRRSVLTCWVRVSVIT